MCGSASHKIAEHEAALRMRGALRSNNELRAGELGNAKDSAFDCGARECYPVMCRAVCVYALAMDEAFLSRLMPISCLHRVCLPIPHPHRLHTRVSLSYL